MKISLFTTLKFLDPKDRLISLRKGWEFPTKNNSAEDGIDETNSLFHGTENSLNSVPNPSADEKNAQNSIRV
jgi:hypothetical protein